RDRFPVVKITARISLCETFSTAIVRFPGRGSTVGDAPPARAAGREVGGRSPVPATAPGTGEFPLLPFVNERRAVLARTRPPHGNRTVSSLFPCGGLVLRRAPGAAQPAGE